MTDSICKIEFNEIEHIVKKLSNFYDADLVNIWALNIIKSINLLFKKYVIYDYILNERSYMGIVIDCYSKAHGNIYIKAVPIMINRFETEVNTLRLLPSELTCKLIELDYENKIIVMEKIIPGDLVEFYPNKEIVQMVFVKLYEKKIRKEDITDFKYKDFFDVVKNDYEICKMNNYNNELVDRLYKIFCEKYQKISENKEKYLLHGDVYKNNLLLSGDGAKVIDPLGFVAPYVFELLPICAYEMFYNLKNNNDVLNDFIAFFKQYASFDEYKEALFCQLVKLYIPSIYEANDGGLRASKWLDIMKDLYPQIFNLNSKDLIN